MLIFVLFNCQECDLLCLYYLEIIYLYFHLSVWSRVWVGSLNMAVIGVHCAQLCASLTMEGHVQEAQSQLKAQQDLLKQIRYDCSASEIPLTFHPGKEQVTEKHRQNKL